MNCPYCHTENAQEVLPRRREPLYQCRAPGCRLRFSAPTLADEVPGDPEPADESGGDTAAVPRRRRR